MADGADGASGDGFDEILGEVRDDAEVLAAHRLVSRLEVQLAEARREKAAARSAVRELTTRVEEAEAVASVFADADASTLDPPAWVAPKKKASEHHAILTTILSDAHFDEVVNPDEIGGVNAYDREIATKRLKRYFEQLCFVGDHYMAGVTIDGVVLMLGGDMLTGEIHEELTETNADTVMSGLLYWSEEIAAGIQMLLERYGKVQVYVVVGNHGRTSRKPRMKLRAKRNFDWLLGHMVARYFEGNDDVSFTIPESAHIHFDIYKTTYRLEHGDSAKGGGGWIGAIGPVMKREQKVRTASQAMDQDFDHMVIGHWHQLSWLSGATINGSNKGYDEFASIMGFGYEDPQQAAWLTTPTRGITLQCPVFVMDRKTERW